MCSLLRRRRKLGELVTFPFPKGLKKGLNFVAGAEKKCTMRQASDCKKTLCAKVKHSRGEASLTKDPIGLNKAAANDNDSSAACAEGHLHHATSETQLKGTMAFTAKGVTITMSTTLEEVRVLCISCHSACFEIPLLVGQHITSTMCAGNR